MSLIKDHVQIGDVQVPIKLFLERRKSVRVSFGKSSVNIRIPSRLSAANKKKHLDEALNWINRKSRSQPQLLEQYKVKTYKRRGQISIFETTINYSLFYENRKQGKGIYNTETRSIELFLPLNMEEKEKSKMIKRLFSRVCASLFQQEVEDRVREINKKCFQKEIKSVNLKYNQSNWGSCSSASNINLSTRLLFAPKDVLDYVIIHELAHLYEMNHSSKFWNIVSQVMPDYKEKEQWLMKNGHLCDF